MFLALNELLKEKSRFALIAFVVVLVSYLVFFLLALAYGLATSYTQAIDKWDATGIVLNENANNVVGRSIITEGEYRSFLNDDRESHQAAPLGVGTATAEKDGSDDVALFGIDADTFLAPDLKEGRGIQSQHEVIVSDELAEIGVTLGTTLKLQSDPASYSVVGITTKASFQTAPVVYMSLQDWRDAASATSGMIGMRNNTSISAIILKGEGHTISSPLEAQSIKDFSFTLPGYQAQVLTFSLMIGFLIGIAAFVLAIFIYILTLQKKSIFGVLKAEGIPSSYIARSVVIQVLILSVGGLVIGMSLAILTGTLLAGKVPFAINPTFFAGISALFIVCALLGALASVRSVTKIDPVEAIG